MQFRDVGQLNPHAYRPNEFFASDMVFEGLVNFEERILPDGTRTLQALPALAASWTIVDTPATKERVITFQLREGVVFHDGAPWNAAAAKKNFDNVFAPALATPDWHGWYDLPLRYVRADVLAPMTIAIRLDSAYYPAIQDFAFIRPLRFLSPLAFPDQLWPGTNSCPTAWGNITGPAGSRVVCKGVLAPIGTGPFKFQAKVTTRRTISVQDVARDSGVLLPGEKVTKVVFAAHTQHWAGPPDLSAVEAIVYPDHHAVRSALLDGSLDVAYGVNTISADDFLSIRTFNHSVLTAHMGRPINTRLLAINSGGGPTASRSVRGAIIASVDQQKLAASTLRGLEPITQTIFSPELPFCDVRPVPLPQYDPEKANLLLLEDGWQTDANGIRRKNGATLTLSFLLLDSQRSLPIASVVASDLRALGIDIILTVANKEQYNAWATIGNFSIILTETWGSPYDPHSTASAWRVPNEADFEAQQGMSWPMTKAELDANITAAMVAPEAELQRRWEAIILGIAGNNIYAPISSIVNLAVVSNTVESFRMGVQQFDIGLTLRALRRVRLPQSTPSPATVDYSAWIAAGILIPTVVLLLCALERIIRREREGKPMFAPLLSNASDDAAGSNAEQKEAVRTHVSMLSVIQK